MRSIHKKADRKDVNRMIQILNSVYPVSDALAEEIYHNMTCFELEKDEVLVEEGTICTHMHFILNGALMGYSTHKGKKITTYISIENEFVSSISGMHGMNPTKEGVIAVEPTRLIAISNEVLNRFFREYFDMNFLFRVMVEKYYQDAQERSHIIRVGNAKERYLYFLQTKPGYMERLPLECVASLLDMKPLTLAKIQKQHALSLQKDKETEEWCKKIEAHLGKYHSYKEKNISLTSLASELELSTHKLSSLINNHYHLSFFDFINHYRIKSIQEQMTMPDKIQSYTIEALAYNSGFASRSAFYKAFKKLVGMSPVEYANSI
jgi:AraC-like DNA-binding protein